MRLSAVSCLRRGWTNLAANWELVLIQWLESFLLMTLAAAGPLAALLALGMPVPASGLTAGHDTAAALRRTGEPSPELLLALVALAAVWLLALLVHGFFQAGAYGVLNAAERQALPGLPRHRLLFRTFSRRDFCGWGGLYVWRFAGLRVLFAGLAVALGVAILSWLGFLGLGGAAWGMSAAFGIGCGGALPLAFLAVVLGLWLNVAQAELARGRSGVRAASRQGLALLGRRLGTVSCLVFLFVLAAAGLAMVFLPVSALTGDLLAAAPRWRAFVQLLLLLLETLPTTLLAMVLAASLVALVRSETRAVRGHSEVQLA